MRDYKGNEIFNNGVTPITLKEYTGNEETVKTALPCNTEVKPEKKAVPNTLGVKYKQKPVNKSVIPTFSQNVKVEEEPVKNDNKENTALKTNLLGVKKREEVKPQKVVRPVLFTPEMKIKKAEPVCDIEQEQEVTEATVCTEQTVCTEPTVCAEPIVVAPTREELAKEIASKTDDEVDLVTEEKETYKEISPIRLILKRFFRSKLSIVGLVMIAFLFLFSYLGPVLYPKWQQDIPDEREVTYENKATYTYFDDNNTEVICEEVLLLTIGTNSYASPSGEHLLGTDDKGMDVFVRLMYGGQISLTIGFIVVILETLIGIIIGGISGYFGGWVDNVLMRIVDIFNCIPTLPILLIASAVIDSWNIEPDQQIYILMVIITIFSWSGVARLVRGQILYLREQEYITATEVMGIPTWRKIFKHLIPNVMPQLIVSMTLGLGSVILYESTLSYLGLGVKFPKAAWGSMIATANDTQVLKYHVNMWLPAGIMIVIAVLGFNFVGDGLRDAMDPKAKK